MPKANKAHHYVTEYPGIFKTDGGVLFCICYGINVSCNRQSQVTQHLETYKQIGNYKFKSNKEQVS